jgi:hypothetical protein
MKQYSIWIPLTVALVIQVFTALSTPCIPMNDSVWYLSQTLHYPVPRPVDFYSPTQPPSSWDVHFPPGLPLVLDVCMGIFGRFWIIAFMCAQHCFRLLTVWLIMQIGITLGRPRLGWWAALFYGLHFVSVLYCQALLSEPLFTFLLTAGVWAMCHAVVKSNRRWWWYAGLFFGLMGLVRFQVVISLGAACVALLALTPRLPLRRRVVHALIVLVLPVCSIAFTVGWNGLVFKRWTITTFKGRHFFERAFLFSNLDAGDNAEYATLAEKGGLYDPATGGVTVEKQYWYAVYPRLRIAGSSCTDADELMGSVALSAIRDNPLTYLGDIGMNILLIQPGNLMSHDGFIPEPIWRQRTRPSEAQNPWLVPGVMAGPPAETLARRILFTEYYVPDAPPLPERLRQGILNALLLLPEWNEKK